MTRRGAAAAVLALAVACAPSGERTEILVFAAASLTGAFGEIGDAFEAGRPDVAVRFSFGPSDGLATQIAEGAPADVFASASPRWMDAVAADPGATARATFARNSLVLLVPASNPAAIEGLADLVRPGVKLVLAAEGVPAGEYARQALARANLTEALDNLVSNEQGVTGVVQKVVLDEADAGIAYRTDLSAAVRSRVRAIGIPERWNVVASYPIAVVASSAHPDAARAFVGFVLGPGRAVLRRAGFGEP